MTSSEEDRTDDVPGAKREPDASPESGAAPSSSDEPKHRREFLAKLIAMTFLTAGVVRTGLAQHTGQGGLGDGTCGPMQGGTIAEDEDCGTPADAVDNDCGLARPASAGGGTFTDNDCTAPAAAGPPKDNDCGKATGEGTGTHSDQDCNPSQPNRADSDCGGLTGDGAARHSDSHCSASHVDFDCGYPSDSGGTTANGDLCCSPTNSNAVDEGCGMNTGSGTAEEDENCTSPGALMDEDCGRALAGDDAWCATASQTATDHDCDTTNLDNDTCSSPSPDNDWWGDGVDPLPPIGM